MLTTSLERRHGRPALLRRADGDDAERLREEVAALTAMADLAVPRVLAWRDHPTGVEAETSYVPAARGLSLEQLAAAAGVLAAAHDRHIGHGRFSAESVRIGPAGGVVVDGWAGIADKSTDVAAVGAVLEGILATPGRGGRRRLALTGLASRAVSDDPSTRPGMAALADGIRPPSETATAHPDRPRRPPAEPENRAASASKPTPSVLLLGGAFAVLAGVLGVMAAPGASSTPSPTAGVDAGPGPVVMIGASRVRVGEAGDLAVAGRWRCAATATPAVLRPDGSVWLWTDLAGEPALVGTVPGGHTVERGQGADGCDLPLVRDRAGNPMTVSP